MVLKSKDRDAIVTGRSTGHPVRTLKNKLAKEILNMEKEGQSPEKIDKRGIGSLRIATVEGDIHNGSFMAGQIASIIKDIKPCKEILDDMVSQARNIMPNIEL